MPGTCVGLQPGAPCPVPGCNCPCCESAEEKNSRTTQLAGWWLEQPQQTQLGPQRRQGGLAQQQLQRRLGGAPPRPLGLLAQQKSQLGRLDTSPRPLPALGLLARQQTQPGQLVVSGQAQQWLQQTQPGPGRPLGQLGQLPPLESIQRLAAPAQQQQQQQLQLVAAPPAPQLGGKPAYISYEGTYSQGALKLHYLLQALIKFSGFEDFIEGFCCHQDTAVDGCLVVKGGYREILLRGEAGLSDICCSCFESKSTGRPFKDNPEFKTRRTQLEYIKTFCMDGYVVFIWVRDLLVDGRDGTRHYGRSPDELLLQYEVLAGVRAALVPCRSFYDWFEWRLDNTDGYKFNIYTSSLTKLPGFWEFDPFTQAHEAVVRLIGGATWWDSLESSAAQRLVLGSGQLPPFQHGAFMPFHTRPYSNTGYMQLLGKGVLARLGWPVVELPGPGGAASGLVVGLPEGFEWDHLLLDNPDDLRAGLRRYGREIRVGGSVRDPSSSVTSGSVVLALSHDTGDGIITKDPGHLQALFVPMPNGLLWACSIYDWQRLTDGCRMPTVSIPASFRPIEQAFTNAVGGYDMLASRLRIADLLVDPSDPAANLQVAIALGFIKQPRTPLGGVPVALTRGYKPILKRNNNGYYEVQGCKSRTAGRISRSFRYGPDSCPQEEAEAAAAAFGRVLWREDHDVRSEAEEAVFWSQ